VRRNAALTGSICVNRFYQRPFDFDDHQDGSVIFQQNFLGVAVSMVAPERNDGKSLEQFTDWSVAEKVKLVPSGHCRRHGTHRQAQGFDALGRLGHAHLTVALNAEALKRLVMPRQPLCGDVSRFAWALAQPCRTAPPAVWSGRNC
jgi:hypothetical protein